jgi:twitching motility protein PilU
MTMDLTPLLQLMHDKNASDLYLTVGIPPTMRIDGKTTPVAEESLTPDGAMAIVTSMMSPAQREEFEATHECNFAISAEGIGRFRASAFIQRNHAGAVLRRIETYIPTIEELNLPPILKNLAMTKRGLIIFIGATGTGKSTSLAAMLGYRNKNGTGHIITIEDPIEFVHKHEGCIITQREVGIDTESFEKALKNTLRQAPDVILIGEVRDRETMNHAIAFAETGHLCLATLHANNANQAMDRIINFFPEERRQQLFMDLSMNMKAFIAQQLIPKKDGNGRRACLEILLGTPLVSDVIQKGEIHKLKEVMKQSTQQGMVTFDQALFNLYKEGEISYDDALHYADSANEVRLMIKLDEGDVDKFASAMDNVFLQEQD